MTDYHQKQEERETAMKEQESFAENCQTFEKELADTEERIHRLEEEKRSYKGKWKKFLLKMKVCEVF